MTRQKALDYTNVQITSQKQAIQKILGDIAFAESVVCDTKSITHPNNEQLDRIQCLEVMISSVSLMKRQAEAVVLMLEHVICWLNAQREDEPISADVIEAVNQIVRAGENSAANSLLNISWAKSRNTNLNQAH